MFNWIRIFEIVLFSMVMPGPAFAIISNITTCEEFERNAYFNPYETLDSMWKIFYFWADNTELFPIVFSLPAKKKLDKIIGMVNAVDPDLDIDWSTATLIMEPRPGTEVVLLYAITPGAFRALVKIEQRTKVRPSPLPLIKFADIRMKLVGRYLSMMCCEDMTAYVMARLYDIPKTEAECVSAASTIGFSGPNGRSYLQLHKTFDEF